LVIGVVLQKARSHKSLRQSVVIVQAYLADIVAEFILTQTGKFVRSLYLLGQKKRQTANGKVQSKI
jgi:hypothetical protein